jgi:hypothetical protein
VARRLKEEYHLGNHHPRCSHHFLSLLHTLKQTIAGLSFPGIVPGQVT